MAVKTKEEIAQEIIAHIDKTGGEYNLWYVGTTNSEPKSVIFDVHKVSRDNGKWIYRTTENGQEARAVINILNGFGINTIAPNKPLDDNIVYAFKKAHTVLP